MWGGGLRDAGLARRDRTSFNAVLIAGGFRTDNDNDLEAGPVMCGKYEGDLAQRLHAFDRDTRTR